MLAFRCLLALELFRDTWHEKVPRSERAKEHVPNPLYSPEKLNALVATFSDTVVPFPVMLGTGTRLVILPTIGVTAIGYFAVHRNDDLKHAYVPYMYTLSCFFTGAGRRYLFFGYLFIVNYSN